MISINQVHLVFDVHSFGVEDCTFQTYMERYQAKQERQENLKLFSLSSLLVAGNHAWSCTRPPWKHTMGPAVRVQTLGKGGK